MVERYYSERPSSMVLSASAGMFVKATDYDALAARLAEAERFIAEIRDESAEDFRTSRYVVVQMTEQTWDKLRATDSASTCRHLVDDGKHCVFCGAPVITETVSGESRD